MEGITPISRIEKYLDQIEQNTAEGGGGGGSSGMESLKITFTDGTADTTWQQAYEALAAGKFVYTLEVIEGDALMIHWYQAAINNGNHVVIGTSDSYALAETANGYLFYD